MNHRDMQEEMRHHLEARADDLRRRGIPADEAMRQARLEFGSIARYEEEGREALGFRLVDRLRMDLRVAFRALQRNPLFALVAVLTLAVGIGANVLVLSLVHGVILKPLTYAGAERIYSVRTLVPVFAHLYPDLPVNARHFSEWRRVCTGCESLALVAPRAFNLAGVGNPERVQGLAVSARLFPMLGVGPALGRTFRESEDQPGADRVMMISDDLWRRSFGADPGVIGRQVRLDQTPREIVGVLPAGFRMPRGEQMGAILRLAERADVFVPSGIDPLKTRVGGNFNLGALVKLRPGVTVSQAVAEMNRPLAEFSKRVEQEMFVRLLPLKERMTGEVRRPLWLLTGAAAALLLIVCVNLGNLLMARAAGRQREAAIRIAVGASRADLFRYALTEALALALAGGVAGLGLAWAGLRLVEHLAPLALPRLEEVRLDWPVLLASFLLSSAAGVLCSLAPAWSIWRAGPQQTLGAASQRTGAHRGEQRLRRTLVAFEAGLSMALAAAAGLLVVSFARLMAVDRGFATEHVLTFQLALPEGRYGMERRNAFHAELLDKLAAIPGVSAAGLTSHLPLHGETWVSQLRRKGDTRHYNSLPHANYRFVSPDYFRAVGTSIRAGRGFAERERNGAVVVISERVAKKVFPGENPIGQWIHYNDDRAPQMMMIVGVAADVKTAGLEADPPLIVYLPFWHLAAPGASYVLRSARPEADLVAEVRGALAAIDRELPIHRVRTMAQIVETSVAGRRLHVLLAGGFAAAGVLLACLGVFGVVSHGVARRTSEIGIRMALGASRGQVVAMVLREALRPVAVGLLGGAAAALTFGRLLASQLYGVSPRDPWVLTGTAVAIALAALLAALWPARRAAGIQPIEALRWE